MKINTQFTIAVHTLLCIAYFSDSHKVTSDFIASSTNVNSVIIRKIIGKLQTAGFVETKAGVGGSTLALPARKITLKDIYCSVCDETEEERSVFNFHSNPNSACPVGSKIHEVLNTPLSAAQKAMEEELQKTTLEDLLSKIIKSAVLSK